MEHSELSPRVDQAHIYSEEVKAFEDALLLFLDRVGLPTQSVLVTGTERSIVFSNIDRVVAKLPSETIKNSVYISKFIAAVASGLFDAALNYLWNETVQALRHRVAQYDLSYFLDIAVSNPERRRKLKDEADLVRLDDSELIQGALKIELISEIGFRHLSYINYMRNWASAAHPNQSQITGLQLLSWIETCVTEVIAQPVVPGLIQIQSLLNNIKSSRLTDSDAKMITPHFSTMSQRQANNLILGFFGIFTDSDTTNQTRQNIRILSSLLWIRVDEGTRTQIGGRFQKFAANSDQQKREYAREFLDIVDGAPYLPDDIRGLEIEEAVHELLSSHRNLNNFYNEPAFARQLSRLVGGVGNIPRSTNAIYVIGLVEVFLTNGNGVVWSAEPIYLELLQQFDSFQALTAVLSFSDPNISTKLQFTLCREKYLELMTMMRSRVSAPAVKEMIDKVEAFTGPLDRLKDDVTIKRHVDNLVKILNLV